MKMLLSQIIIDDSIYPRGSGVNDFNTTRLVHAAKAGATFPPLTVDSVTYRLVDGRHRYLAYKRLDLTECEVELKTYASEADLYADAVRLNVGHGDQLDQYSVRNAIIRLLEYGYERNQISEVVRLPLDQIDKIERGFATSASDGRPIALKGGLDHLHGRALTDHQQDLNRRYSGLKATFHARQLADLLEAKMWPSTAAFAEQMDRIVHAWTAINKAQQRSAKSKPAATASTTTTTS